MTNGDGLDEVAARIRGLRDVRRLRQREVAALVGVSERGYQNYERGKSRPSYERLDRLAQALDTTPEYIMFGEVEEPAGGLSREAGAVLERIEAQVDAIRRAVQALAADAAVRPLRLPDSAPPASRAGPRELRALPPRARPRRDRPGGR